MLDKYSMATIQELESFKMGDAVKFHKELNPRLWDNEKLDSEVRDQLLLIAEDFVEYLGLDNLKVEDVTISGSNAAYSYTPHSDLDLHILVDFNKLPNDPVYQELFTAKKTLYNDLHDITVREVPVELYVQDTNQVHTSLGEYSIVHAKWIRIPKKRRANFDEPATKLKYEKLGNLIELALKSKDIKRVKHTLDIIKRYRKGGLEKAGEFGPENLAFKAIRKQGLIQKLYDLKAQLHAEKLSIEEDNLTETAEENQIVNVVSRMAADKIVKIMQKNEGKILSFLQAGMTPKTHLTLFGLKTKDLNVPAVKDPLINKLLKTMEIKVNANLHDKNSNIKGMYYVDDNEIELWFPALELTAKKLGFSIQSEVASTLAHEIQHAIDDLKSQGKALQDPASFKGLDKDYQGYLKRPYEVNARFQQATMDIAKYIATPKKDGTSTTQKDLPELIRYAFEINLLDKIYEKNQKEYKRLLSRAYKFFQAELNAPKKATPQNVVKRAVNWILGNPTKEINESYTSIADAIKSKLGLKQFIVTERGHDLILDSLIVGKENQGKGLGTKAMKELIDYADQNGKRIILTPGVQDKTHGTTSRSRLVKFYKSLGFKENKGRSIDFAMGAGKMYRDPAKNINEYIQDLKSYRNPSPKTLYNLTKRSAHNHMRGMYHNGDTYWWDANDAIHADGSKLLGIPYDYLNRLEAAIDNVSGNYYVGGDDGVPTEVTQRYDIEELTESINNVMYHVTPTKNLRSIMKQGLTPRVGDRSANLDGEESGIFLFPTLDDVDSAVSSWLGDEFDEDEELSLLAVDVSGLPLVDSAAGYEKIAKTKINPDRISLSNELMLESLVNKTKNALKLSASYNTIYVCEGIHYSNDILLEQRLYENFLNSATQFLGQKANQTMANVKGQINDTINAGIVIKDIISNPQLLTNTTSQIRKWTSQLVKNVTTKIQRIGQQLNAPQLTEKLIAAWEFISRKVAEFGSSDGWKGFLGSLGLYGFVKFINEMLQNLTTLKSTIANGALDALLDKAKELGSSVLGNITMPGFLAIFDKLTTVKKYFLDVLTQVKDKFGSINVPGTAQFSKGVQLEASGYIPSQKEKNDPRFKTALTVDVKPDSIKKNAKAFNWKTSRAGIPPQARADGKITEDRYNGFALVLPDKKLSPEEYTPFPKLLTFEEYTDTTSNSWRTYSNKVRGYLSDRGIHNNELCNRILDESLDRIKKKRVLGESHEFDHNSIEPIKPVLNYIQTEAAPITELKVGQVVDLLYVNTINYAKVLQLTTEKKRTIERILGKNTILVKDDTGKTLRVDTFPISDGVIERGTYIVTSNVNKILTAMMFYEDRIKESGWKVEVESTLEESLMREWKAFLAETAVNKDVDVNYHMDEGCGAFAYALWIANGKPANGDIMIISNVDGEPWFGDEESDEPTHDFEATHVYYDDPILGPVDVKGPRSVNEMINDFRIHATVEGPYNPEYFKNEWMGMSDDKPLYFDDAMLKEALSIIKSNPSLYLNKQVSEEQQDLFPGYDEKHKQERLSAWLGKSHAMAGKKPKVLYHATTKHFDQFRTQNKGWISGSLIGNVEIDRTGIFLAENPKFAEEFIKNTGSGPEWKENAIIIPVYLSAQSPFSLLDNSLLPMLRDEALVEEFDENGIDLKAIYHHYYEDKRWELFDGPEGQDFVQNLKRLGYDSAVMQEEAQSHGGSETVWVAFDPSQVKAITNRGSFSPDDPRLMREDQKNVVPKVGYHVTATKNLPVIRKNGIKADKRGNIYVWDSLEMAEWFTDFQNDEGQDRTILKIDMTGIDARPDPEAEDMSEWSSRFKPGTTGGAWIVSGSIPPNKIID